MKLRCPPRLPRFPPEKYHPAAAPRSGYAGCRGRGPVPGAAAVAGPGLLGVEEAIQVRNFYTRPLSPPPLIFYFE